ncbi:MAG: EAL domain-containing protein [Gammaproteobacteria bacterium]
MADASAQDQVLGDYAALLRSLLPEACGFYCYSRDGAAIWKDPGSGAVSPNSRYDSALTAFRNSESPAPERVDLDRGAAFLLPLCSEKDQILGVLVILVEPPASSIDAARCLELTRPAVQTLQRELSLRFRLLEGYRKLNVQAAEERLLHDVDRVAHDDGDCNHVLGKVLALCRHYLQVDSAALLVPDRRIALIQGDGLKQAELTRMLDASIEAQREGNSRSMPPDQWFGSDIYTINICHSEKRQAGILALAGWRTADFSQRRRSRVARYLASHIEAILQRGFDSLTGFMAWPNFEDLLKTMGHTSGDSHHALLYFDMDRLHVANDTLGREIGDEILTSFARIAREELPGHLLTRITSDSFAALLMDTGIEAARQHAETICSHVRLLEFGRGDRIYRASVSIGVGPLGGGDEVEGGPLAAAKVACGAAKDRGRGRVELYQAEDESIIQRFDDIRLVGQIRNAIESDRLMLVAQPIVPIKEGTGHPYCEVLIRFLDDEDRHMSPADFLSAAERYQLMEELDRWVVTHTLQLLEPHAVRLAGTGTRFAINLSGQSLGSEQFLPFVQERIAASCVPPEMLCFEITESVAVANLQRAQTFMHTLKRTGCKFSLDDFGTGLSSFAYLKLFPIDTLKIDGSFIRDLSTNVVSQSVVAAISEVARVMQLDSVAEFVQDAATLALLRKLGITWAQGYLFGQPASLSERIAGLAGSNGAATAVASPLKSRSARHNQLR